MSKKLPSEIILRVSKLVGADSTLDLKPLTLVDRHWHDVAAPMLLATISVSSLGQVVKLCEQIDPSDRNEVPPSSIVAHAKTLVISGVIWAVGTADCHFGLEDLGEQPRGDGEGDELVEPDVNISSQDVSEKLRAAMPLLASLDGLEWYGRFAGDYCLIRYLQTSGVIRRLTYGIDMFTSTVSPAYYDNVFQFSGLRSLSITTEYEPEGELFPRIAEMIHRNPDLEDILFDCKYAESLTGKWSLLDLIRNESLSESNKPITVFPELRRLVLRFFQGSFWQSSEEVEMLAEFLVAHPKLELLYLYETCLEDSQSETAQTLSLRSHPNALPSLKQLLGSTRLISGVLESKAACASVHTIIDQSEEGFDSDGAKGPHIERIMSALEEVSENCIQRLMLEVPQLSRSIYTKIAKLAPKIRFPEFLRPMDVDSTTPEEKGFDPLVDIPSGLNEFPNLDTVGQHIAADFVRACDQGDDSMVELARIVPRLRHVHGGNGILVTFDRAPEGDPSVSNGVGYLENVDYDWMTFEVDWRHRPMSRRKVAEVRESEGPWDIQVHFISGTNTCSLSAYTMGFESLSTELIGAIVKCLPWCHLVSVSLVSRQWQIVAFPLLHSTINLFNDDRWVDIIEQAQDGDSVESSRKALPRAHTCVRRLYIGPGVTINHQRLEKFACALDRMPNLESLYWDVKNADRSWRDIVARMTGLRSLALVVPPHEFPSNNANITMKAPANLRELLIVFDCIAGMESSIDDEVEHGPGEDSAKKLLASAASLIGDAVNIESLNIRLQDAEQSYHWAATDLFFMLCQGTYPALRSIRFSACKWPDSTTSTFTDLFTESAFWKFLKNHQQLHTVVLDTIYDDYQPSPGGEAITIHPHHIISFMPSVRHFEGPCAMFEAIINSGLGQQLETLGLLESGPSGLGTFQDLLPRLGNLGIPELPGLKCLKIYARLTISDARLRDLVTLIRNMPALECLILSGLSMMDKYPKRDPSKYLTLLETLPKLRKLVIPDSPFPPPIPPHKKAKFLSKFGPISEDLDPKSFFIRAGQLCPELESVHLGEEGFARWAYSGRWDIIRQGPRGTPVDVVYVCSARWQNPPHGWVGNVIRGEESPLEFWPRDPWCGGRDPA